MQRYIVQELASKCKSFTTLALRALKIRFSVVEHYKILFIAKVSVGFFNKTVFLNYLVAFGKS